VPLAQPYRAFVKEVLEHQVFPVRHYTPGGEIIRPYDVTSWSLPLHYGVEAVEVVVRSEALESVLAPLPEGWGNSAAPGMEGVWGLGFSAQSNDSYRAVFQALQGQARVYRLREPLAKAGRELPAGSFLVRGDGDLLARLAGLVANQPLVLTDEPETRMLALTLPRIALVESYFHDMDAGWTRYLFDSYDIPYRVLRPGDLGKVELDDAFDVVVFPDISQSVLAEGKEDWRGRYYAPDYPPKYRETVGEDGIDGLRDLLDEGGVVVAWGRSGAYLLEQLGEPGGDKNKGAAEVIELPARDISEDLAQGGLFVPGAFLRLTFLEGHELTLGMPREWGGFSRGRPVFETSIPSLDTDRRVVAVYPEKDILLSGYLEGEEQMGGKAAAVWVRRGRGQLALFGFQPQFRASTPATYKLVFNALLLPDPELVADH
jgi:hypothetical protein